MGGHISRFNVNQTICLAPERNKIDTRIFARWSYRRRK